MPLSPPRPLHPPLNALRAFEAAARHNSFQRAAEELGVTPGAIAQQIRKLEDWSGCQLFERRAHGVEPTALTAAILPELTRSFDAIGQIAHSLRAVAERLDVAIAALPAVAQLWLSPRLSALRQTVPAAALSVHALDACPDPARGAFDLAIYPMDRASAGWPEVHVVAENSLTPVAAPHVASGLTEPDRLRDSVLIHDLAWKSDWSMWLRAHGVADVAADRGPTHSLYSIAVERCVAGDGVLIGHTALIGPHLADGRLAAPFPDRTIAGRPLCLLAPARETAKARLAHVIDAILASR